MNPEELYTANEGLVHYVLKTHYPDKQFDEDFHQIGRLGLWKACLTYDRDASRFSTYACKCIRNEIVMELRALLTKKRSSQNYIIVSLDQRTKAPGTENMSILDLIPGDMNVDFIDIKGFWNSLTDREKDIVLCLIAEKTQAEMEKELGISHTTIWRTIVLIKKKWNMYI